MRGFAALIPICGGGMCRRAGGLKPLPIRAHRGLLDPALEVSASIKMVNAVNKNGGGARLSLYETATHDSWNNALSDPNVYEWMLSKHR